MKQSHIFIFLVLIIVFPVLAFSQQAAPSAGVLRDYVGLINQSYHPGIVEYFEKIKKELEKDKQNDAVKAIDLFLKGAIGSGFVISGARGTLYVVTNFHVIQQAHSLSITFERQDNSQKKYENLVVLAADEESDLALLAFPADKPSAGFTLLTRLADEGEDVYAAGFPALGVTPIWQFSRGMVSNSSAKFPKNLLDDTLMGPYIQHTAQVDPGNSGGPLLVVQKNAPSGYAVAGVNTLSGVRRQAANYAIPASKVQAFINDALNQKPDTFKATLDQRLEKFLKGLGENRAVYPHIAEYLSSVCVGENAEYAVSEMYEKGNNTVKRAFIEKCEDGVVGAMGYSVAWIIENSLRGGQGAIKASIKEVTGNGEEYTVVFTVNNKDFNSTWIREYGNWRIKSFGTVASGDKSLVTKKEKEKKTKENLRMNGNFQVEAGYAYLFEKSPAAFYFAVDYKGVFELNCYYVNPNLFSVGVFPGYRFNIPAGNLGFMPYIRLGANIIYDSGYEDYKKEVEHAPYPFGDKAGLPITLSALVGLKVTTSNVPGLFMGTAFQLSLFSMTEYDKLMKKALSFTVGYAF